MAGATYRYKLPGDAKGTRRTFRAPPASNAGAGAAANASPSPASSPASSANPNAKNPSAPAAVFGVVGDTGQTEVTHAVFQHLRGMKDIDVLLHTGDLSYADGFPPRWDSFGRLWVIGGVNPSSSFGRFIRVPSILVLIYSFAARRRAGIKIVFFVFFFVFFSNFLF